MVDEKKEASPGELSPEVHDKTDLADALSQKAGTNFTRDSTKIDLAKEELKQRAQSRTQKKVAFIVTLLISVAGLVVFYSMLTGHKCWYEIACNNSTATDRLVVLMQTSQFTIIAFSLSGIIPAALLIAMLKGVFKNSEPSVDKQDLDWAKIGASIARLFSGKPH